MQKTALKRTYPAPQGLKRTSYRAAWQKFEQVAAKLEKLWKLKRTTAAVLREERR